MFIHGGTGRGKTHLLHAIGQEFMTRRPTARVVSMSAEKFMVEFVRALRENDTIGFKGRLRSADLLLIDDVQFIAGKDSTQEEFFHTMNEIITAGRRLVITSRPRAAGSGRDRAAHPVAPVVGPGRRHQPGRI